MIEDLAKLDAPPDVLTIPGKVKHAERLAEWPPIDAVTLSTATQEQFDRIAHYLNPKDLTLDMVRAEDLSALAKMERLQTLIIDSNSRLTSLDFLTPLPQLTSLAIKATKNPLDLAPLSALRGLRELTLDGGYNYTMKAASLAPLAALKAVETLARGAIRIEDEDLSPLADMTALRDLQITNFFPTVAYARLHALRPDIKSERLAPYARAGAVRLTMLPDGALKDEGQGDYMVTGKRKPFIKVGDEAKLQKYIDQWDALVAKYRAEGG